MNAACNRVTVESTMVEGLNAGGISLLLTLNQPAPAAQRLREVVWAIAASGCEALFLDWGRSYPWGLEEGPRSDPAYREEFIPGLVREAENRGMALHAVFPAVDSHELGARAATYRNGFRFQGGALTTDLATREGRGLVRRLLEALSALEPDTSSLLVNWRVPPLEEEAGIEVFRELFGSSGLELLIRPVGELRDSPFLEQVSAARVPGLKGIVLPAAVPFTSAPGELLVVREYPLQSGNQEGDESVPEVILEAERSNSALSNLRALSGEPAGAGELALLRREEPALEYDRFSC